MSIANMKWVYEQTLPPSIKFTLLVLADHCPDEGYVYLANETLCKITGYSRRTVQEHKRYLLREKFLIDSGYRDHRTGQIHLLMLPTNPCLQGGADSAPLKGAQQDVPRGAVGCTQTQVTQSVSKGSKKKIVVPPGVVDEVWIEYVQHRKELGKSLTPLARQKQGKFLAKWTEETQRQIVEQSVRNGWTGLFPVKERQRRVNEMPGANRTRDYSDSELAKLAKPGETWDDVRRRLSRQEAS